MYYRPTHLVAPFCPRSRLVFVRIPTSLLQDSTEMKANSLRRVAARRQSLAASCPRVHHAHIRPASSVSQRPNSDFVSFPGALKSAFTSNLAFENPQSYTALPTYRVVDQHGVVVDESFRPDISDETVIKLYTDMLYISILDMIMFDAQRQGRISFYAIENAAPV